MGGLNSEGSSISRRFRAACRDHRLAQEFITPYIPEQNGIVERFFRSVKKECVWQHNFVSFEHARRELTAWILWYNEGRPHQALGYRRIPGARRNAGGLIPREHYSTKRLRWLDSEGALHNFDRSRIDSTSRGAGYLAPGLQSAPTTRLARPPDADRVRRPTSGHDDH